MSKQHPSTEIELCDASLDADGLVQVTWADGTDARFDTRWLRDNCPCSTCRVAQTEERRFFSGSLTSALTPKEIAVRAGTAEAGCIRVDWGDHRSEFTGSFLAAYRTLPPPRYEPRYWDATDVDDFPVAECDAVMNDDGALLRWLVDFRAWGVGRLVGVPAESEYVVRIIERFGHLRRLAFDRIHDVRVDPAGYNVAHTAEPLPPHADFPGYRWPPSLQLLHMLENPAGGGPWIAVDGWRLANELRAADPDGFRLLTEVWAPWRMFSADEETYARGPLVWLDDRGAVAGVRFSNQVMQPIELPAEELDAYYDAYTQYARAVVDPRNQAIIPNTSGDLLMTHAHRTFHGRQAFDPEAGPRWLQDGYAEFDDLDARITVLQRKLETP